ncbi:glycoside hydrolase family 127 protein [Perspicuibacillus lycopersici]|uniref:glycoside hydrolase family 127 protein n=1 Tax=Perspicuibacillus lycopersici TaxID=1325689 RepID=UPI003899C46D
MKSIENVQIKDTFWRSYLETVKKEVIPYQWEALNDRLPNTEPSHAIENFRIAAGEAEGEFFGMVFQDSDVAKWLEAVAYILKDEPNEQLEKTADEVIDLLERAQQEDGYLNTYYTIKEPNNRWTNLTDNHELYCAGHLIEAAVAYYKATNKRKFLDVVCKYADYIDQVFGEEEGKIHGYPGHQEIELALLKLYEVTENERYLHLSHYFIHQRGKQPHYFDEERKRRGQTGPNWYIGGNQYNQSHQPVIEQKQAVGHSVRAVYMYTAMADLAKKTNNESLKIACENLWENVTQKQMYITGGIGSSEHGESFSFDYDLPNDTSYTETCASVGLVFWARNMLGLEKNRKYADVMERALYNGTISGMDLDGKKFFYVNPLEVWPKACNHRFDKRHVKAVRQQWFTCACCPPNLARMIGSIGDFIYSTEDNQLFVHLYIGSESAVSIKNQKVKVIQETNYPWDGDVKLSIEIESATEFTIALRIPGWCKNPVVKVNNQLISVEHLENGYLYINRTWENNDQIELIFPMKPERIWSNPKVRENLGKVAIQRGPILYCLEEVDNGKELPAIQLPRQSILQEVNGTGLFEGMVTIKAEAYRLVENTDDLYVNNALLKTPCIIKAVPYFAWCNRQPGEMLVWINEDRNV